VTSAVISALEPADGECELAQPAQLVARDPDAHRLLGPRQAPGDPRAPLAREQRAAGQLQFGPKVVQMPQQGAVELHAMANESLAVVDEQPQIELGPLQVRGREGLQAFLQRDAGDVERVDGIRLAALTGAAARVRGQMGRDPQHPLAALDQKPLQRPRDVPAVLKRPHPLAVEAARPHQQRAEPATTDRDGLLAHQLAGNRGDRGDRVRPLVGVRAKHDHDPRPSCSSLQGGRLADTACWRRCHASIKSRQTSPTGDERQNTRKSGPSPADSLKESQLAAGRDHLQRVGRHRRAE
jgi:hypothetical protein